MAFAKKETALNRFEKRLQALCADTLRGVLRGIEKEGLRTTAEGALARTSHPAGLGSALAHPHITTDFSESQLELITGVHRDAEGCVAEITEIHQAVYRHLGDELLWGCSMPCRLPERDDEIPLGRYGSSNVGRAKTIYRNGLSHRYGRRMQTISGIHYNFSLPDSAWPELQLAEGRGGSLREYRDEGYFSLIRNFRRRSWLLLYLFGASPAVCRTFVAGRAHALQPFGADSLHLPYATSLRMGPLGYQSDAQARLAVSYNGLHSFAASLRWALSEPYPAYEAIGLRDGDDYRQLSTTLLQIENEFYGTIRPKRRIRPGERPLHALAERGVEYVEVRCMDIDPFKPVGIDEDTMRFLDVFLLHCLLSDSPPDTPEEIATLSYNQHRAADRGREPGLMLRRTGREFALADWGNELLSECDPIAEALDQARGGRAHRDSLAAAREALREPSATPSARVLEVMQRQHDQSHLAFGLERSRRNLAALAQRPLSPEAVSRFERMARESLESQREIEAADRVPFETYRQQYLGQSLLAEDESAPAE